MGPLVGAQVSANRSRSVGQTRTSRTCLAIFWTSIELVETIYSRGHRQRAFELKEEGALEVIGGGGRRKPVAWQIRKPQIRLGFADSLARYEGIIRRQRSNRKDH